MNRCVIVGAAPVANPACLRTYLREDDWFVAADGGQNTMQAMGITPALVVADFDSSGCPQEKDAAVEVVHLPVCKDETDTLAAAMIAFERGYRCFLLLGCLGGRLDHTMANIQVMAALTAKGCHVVLADEHNEVTLWEPGEYRLDFRPHAGFSLLAYDSVVTGVSIRQAAYTMENGCLTSDYPLGISNEFLPELPAEISFKTGRLLVFSSKD